jgi:hypothetical protein
VDIIRVRRVIRRDITIYTQVNRIYGKVVGIGMCPKEPIESNVELLVVEELHIILQGRNYRGIHEPPEEFLLLGSVEFLVPYHRLRHIQLQLYEFHLPIKLVAYEVLTLWGSIKVDPIDAQHPRGITYAVQPQEDVPIPQGFAIPAEDLPRLRSHQQFLAICLEVHCSEYLIWVLTRQAIQFSECVVVPDPYYAICTCG